jgi:hypothetical protein
MHHIPPFALMLRGICYARAFIGHVAAAPPSSVMNSRLFSIDRIASAALSQG